MNILTKFKNMTAEALRDHKKLIVALYIIFIICFAASWIVSADTINANQESIKQNLHPNPAASSSLPGSEGAADYFIHNEWSGIQTYVASVFFAIPALVVLVYNGINLGAMGAIFNMVLPGGGVQFLIYLIPHGIFEITATVLQSSAGVILFLFIFNFARAFIRTRALSDAYAESKKLLIHSLVIMIFSTILLLIAAPIEAYFSVPFSDFVMGL
ncbi:stage II sporulation protein M [Methanobrevibacter sp.]